MANVGLSIYQLGSKVFVFSIDTRCRYNCKKTFRCCLRVKMVDGETQEDMETLYPSDVADYRGW